MNTNPLYSSGYNNNKDFSHWHENAAHPNDFADKGIDLNEQLVQNKPSTYFMRVNSDAMIGAGIHNGDVVIVDRSLPASNGKVVIAVLNGEMLIRRLYISNNKKRLLPETNKLSAIDVDPFAEFKVWGVVTYVIHQV